jgi:IMP cyclohydrolase
MYVGRIVIVGKNLGRSYVAYRVSSRSFPNRRAEIRGRSILVSPRDPEDLAKNPYIAYNCIRVLDRTAVVANGSHSDMILERIEDGMRPLDAISLSLVAYGYERDELDTPRIAGVVHGDRAYLGIAKKDEFRVKEFDLMDGLSFMVATYEKAYFESINIAGQSPKEIACAAFELSFERPVCAAAALSFSKESEKEAKAERERKGFELAVYNPI